MVDTAEDFVRRMKRHFLLDEELTKKNGKDTWSSKNATPARLSGLVDYLGRLTDYVVAQADEQVDEPTEPPASGSPEVIAWRARLAYYRGALDDCIAAGKGEDPKCVYWSVTNPLLWGWFGAESPECAPDAECTQRPADVGEPFRLAHMLAVRTKWAEEGGWSKFGEYVAESAVEVKDTGAEWAEKAVDYGKELGSKPWEAIAGAQSIIPWVAGAVIVGGVIYLVKFR